MRDTTTKPGPQFALPVLPNQRYESECQQKSLVLDMKHKAVHGELAERAHVESPRQNTKYGEKNREVPN